LPERLSSSRGSSPRENSLAGTISYPVRIKRNRNAKRRSLWRNKELAVKILALLLKRRAGNLDPIPTRTLRALPKKSHK
jgi:hypothetical protein